MFGFRFRHVYMAFFSVLVILATFLVDPDNGFIQNLPIGAGTLAALLVMVRAVIYVTLLHVSRKALFDYLDLEVLFKEAVEKGNVAAANAIIGVAIAMVAIALLIVAAV